MALYPLLNRHTFRAMCLSNETARLLAACIINTCFFWGNAVNTIQASGLTEGWVVQRLVSDDCHLPVMPTTCQKVQQLYLLGFFLSFSAPLKVLNQLNHTKFN